MFSSFCDPISALNFCARYEKHVFCLVHQSFVEGVEVHRSLCRSRDKKQGRHFDPGSVGDGQEFCELDTNFSHSFHQGNMRVSKSSSQVTLMYSLDWNVAENLPMLAQSAEQFSNFYMYGGEELRRKLS